MDLKAGFRTLDCISFSGMILLVEKIVMLGIDIKLILYAKAIKYKSLSPDWTHTCQFGQLSIL